MKLSIAWIFSHMQADYSKYNISELVQKVNTTTAQIDSIEKISYDLRLFTLAQVSQITSQDTITAFSRELNQTIELPFRKDCIENSFYMLVYDHGSWQWASLRDWKSSKEGLLPAFSCTGQECAGSWKQMFDGDDYILDVDNKSITNRPDLWSHRGFAREIAAILGLSLKKEQEIYADRSIEEYEKRAGQTTGNPFSFEIEAQKYCKRFGALYIANIGHYDSWLWMAQRLCKIDAKPIDALVDTTNYVMYDIGQPLHVFDAEKINSTHIVPRFARHSETLNLLDGTTIELTDQDMVITNGKFPIALAGIMGGKDTAIDVQTRSILVESANFDAATIRKTSQRYKVRTEASTRFEKTLDPNANILGLLRFLKILEQHGIPLITASDIVSLGKKASVQTLEVSHQKIEQALGVGVSQDFIQKTLQGLEFSCEIILDDNPLRYSIIVPTFRGTKDIQIPEDIIEEIGRFYGFGNIPVALPILELKPHSLDVVMKLRKIRQCMVAGLQSREVYNYAFYDESFLQKLGWHPEEAVRIVNPVSHNWQYLVTSLAPQMLRSVVYAGDHQQEIRFFEWGRIWNRVEDNIHEQKSLAAIIYRKEPIDFYWAKRQIQILFDVLDLSITWSKYTGNSPWFHPYKTATITYKNELVGYAGMVNNSFMDSVLEGHAFLCELSGEILLTSEKKHTFFKPLAKYQDSRFDVSMFIPLERTVQELINAIKIVDNRIISVELIDFFEKKEWLDKRSIALRVVMQDIEKTLIKEDIDMMYQKVVKMLPRYGAVVR